ncbi:hypothetical protein AR687_22155 [Flavobacteriaceae bacterium CRH]|nr:hypothetical protein AR687_22155 [Flavobacteriaceae bacterium CRH]
MIGLLIELAISWLLLWFLYKTDLSVLGFYPTKNRLYDFVFGFFVIALFCLLHFKIIALLTDHSFEINKNFTTIKFFKGAWWVLVSVLYEEFLFRGALLYILIKKTGINKACIISGIAFGIYHWFSYGAFGNPVQMLFVFFTTGIWGVAFAYAYAKTKSLYLPTGLHLGWNLINVVVYSRGPLGTQLFHNNDKKLDGIISLVFFILPIVTLPIITYFYLRKSKNIELINSEYSSKI